MDIKILSQEYEIIKDGVIVADKGDEITFKLADLTFIFKVQELRDNSRSWEDNFTISPDKKTITFPIKMRWDYLSTTFSKRIQLATFKEGNQEKKLYLSYMISGLTGDNASVYVFRYTWYTKDVK